MDFIEYTYSFIDANLENDEEKIKELKETGKEFTTNYSEVAQAITNVIVGINQQMTANNQQLQILVDSLVEDGVIKDSTLDSIEKRLKEVKE